MQGALDLDWGDVIEEGHIGVEGLGGGGAQGWGVFGQNPKQSRWGSVLANETQGPLSFDWVDVDCEGYTAFEGLEHGERAAHGRGPEGGKKTRIQAIITRFLAGLGLQRRPVKSQERLRWLSRWW